MAKDLDLDVVTIGADEALADIALSEFVVGTPASEDL